MLPGVGAEHLVVAQSFPASDTFAILPLTRQRPNLGPYRNNLSRKEFGVNVRTHQQFMGQAPDGERATTALTTPGPAASTPSRRLWRDWAFLTLSLGMALALFAQIGLIAQLVSVLAPALGAQGAGLAAGLSTAAAIAGRLLVSWFMPANADRRVVASASLLVQVVGCGVLIVAAGTNVPFLLLGAFLFGLGIGNATSLPPLIAQAEVSRADVARMVALIVAISQATYAFAPAVFGFIREVGPDLTIYVVAVAIQMASVAAYLAGRRAGSPWSEQRNSPV